MKKLIFFSYCLFLLFPLSSFTRIQRKYEIKTVVIDAGHGGHDTGCLGSEGKEKDIALAISLKLGKLIQENYPDVRVIYTRKTDVFVELHERAEIANRNKADLFICIHANSGGTAYGTETFVLGLHRAEENLAVSKRENSAILMEKDYKTNYEGFDPNSPEANIIFRLYQNTYLQQSLLFAAKVQDQLNEYAGRLNRGVKQAGLLVLARTTMPGVLIETGFLTNRSEEKYLLSAKGQQQISTAIYRAFIEYKIDMEESPQNNKPSVQPMDSGLPPAENKKTKDSIQFEKNNKDQAVNASDPLPPAKNNKADSSKIKSGADSKLPLQGKNSDSLEALNQNKNPLAENKTNVNKKEENILFKDATTKNLKEVFFTIQLAAIEHPTAKDRDRFKKIEDIQERLGEEGMTRFTAGIFYSLDKAILGQNRMRSLGFKDAFVTAYKNNKRITIKEATTLINVK